MQPLTQSSLAANAYRTLGLSASAGQSAIDAAARRMRIWPDPSRIPPTPWDLPWLGPLSRTRNDIEQAVARLHAPASRAEERLLWYVAPQPPAEAADTPESDEPDAAASSAERHDAAVAALHSAMLNDPHVVDTERWRRVLGRFEGMAASPDYADWVERSEGEGDFEKRASMGEIRAALASFPSALAAGLVPKARAALDRDDIETCAGIVSLLRAASPADNGGGPVRDLLDGLEDSLSAQCRHWDHYLREILTTDRNRPDHYYPANYAATLNTENAYSSKVSPALHRLCRVTADDPDRLVRARSRCAELLALVGLGWEWSGEPVEAERALLTALTLAKGSAVEGAILKDLDRVRPLAEHQRETRDAAEATGWPPPVPTPPRGPRVPATSSGSRSAILTAVLVMAAVGLLRAFEHRTR